MGGGGERLWEWVYNVEKRKLLQSSSDDNVSSKADMTYLEFNDNVVLKGAI